MRIEWDRVTWYSKLAAVMLGVFIFTLGFYFGYIYGLSYYEQKLHQNIESVGDSSNLETSKCVEGQELIEVPSAPQFVNLDEQKTLCVTKVYGNALVAPYNDDVKVTLVRFKEGPIFYNFTQGPNVYTSEDFVLFENFKTGEKREFSIVGLTSQDAIAEIKASSAPTQFSVYTYLLGWWGRDFWGWIDIRGSADPSPPMYSSLFKINTDSWETKTYLLPYGMLLGDKLDGLNMSKGKMLYGEVKQSNLLMDVYDLESGKGEVLVSYTQEFLKNYYKDIKFGDSSCLEWGEVYLRLCPPTEMNARWLGNTAVSYVDLETKKLVTKSGF